MMIEVFNDRQKTQKYQLYAYKCILYNVVRRLVLVKKRHIISSNQSLENEKGKNQTWIGWKNVANILDWL